MKPFFLCLSLCCLPFINANSQTNSRLHNTFNKYIIFSDKVSTQSKSLINCLSNYQRRIYRFKRYNSKPTRIFFPNCTRYQISYQYRDAQEGDIASLNSQTQKTSFLPKSRFSERRTASLDHQTKNIFCQKARRSSRPQI